MVKALIWVIAIIMLGIGGYNVACDYFDVPSKRTSKAMLSIIEQKGQKKSSLIDVYVSRIAKRFRWAIRLDDIKRTDLKNTLRIANRKQTPEEFIVSIVLIGIFITIAFIPVAMLLEDSKFYFFGAVFGIAIAAMQYRKVTGAVAERKQHIVRECPRFASYLANNLGNANRDIIGMFSAYRQTANSPEFVEELSMALADMKTGNYESALLNLQHRVNDPAMTEICRGLQGVLQGDDMTLYFERVCLDMRALEQAMLKKEAMKRPRKITLYQILIMGATIIMMAVALVTQLVDNLRILFSVQI